jgi:23S rRNA pseudouridine1911/1915/1917 synthase
MHALLFHAPVLATLPRAGIVHRLDKNTSGLLVIAKTLTGYTSLVRQLQARTVHREYLALVHGMTPPAGKVEAAIGRHPRERVKMAVVAKGKSATTHYRTLAQGQRWSLLQCRLETGRTHQIRVHLSNLGFPLIGDSTYGGKAMDARLPLAARGFPRQALHALRLGLVHPVTGKTVQWQRAAPADLTQLRRTLEQSDPPV